MAFALTSACITEQGLQSALCPARFAVRETHVVACVAVERRHIQSRCCRLSTSGLLGNAAASASVYGAAEIAFCLSAVASGLACDINVGIVIPANRKSHVISLNDRDGLRLAFQSSCGAA